MDMKVLVELRVPKELALIILTGFPMHEGDKMRKPVSMGKYVKMTWYVNNWTYHVDQAEFLHRHRILCTVYPVSAPRTSLDRYLAYAARS